MKSLKTVQVIVKIAKIISTIVFICCIVGASLCALSLILLPLIPNGITFNGVTIHGLIEASSETTMGTIYSSVACGMIFAIGEAVISKFAQVYFKHELSAGTPFTKEGSKEIFRLGIITAAVSIGTSIIAGITNGIFQATMSGAEEFPVDQAGNVSAGIFFIFIAILINAAMETAKKED